MNLERKEKEVNLMKCRAAKAELELKLLHREQELERIKDHIKLQEEREQELQKELDS